MISSARLQITSFAFMLVDVPAPPWMTSTTNWSCRRPSRISAQAAAIASRYARGSSPSSQFASAAASLTAASATTRYGSDAIVRPEMSKFSCARSVWTP